jgi:hypothetical protein
MGWNGIGWMVAVGLSALGTAVTYLWPGAREFGYFLLGVGALAFMVAGIGAIRSGWPHLKVLRIRLGAARMMLLFGILGTWVFVSFTLAIVAWMIAHQASPANATATDEGPLSWVQNFSMEGGMGGPNLFSLRFRGANTSKESIELKSATITSLIDGTRLELEVVGNNSAGESKIVPISRIQLIPPGAPIELVAKFGPPDPNVPGNILGLESKVFLEKWRQFAFDASDIKHSYHFEFNENAFMPFFRGQVGPRIALKPD